MTPADPPCVASSSEAQTRRRKERAAERRRMAHRSACRRGGSVPRLRPEWWFSSRARARMHVHIARAAWTGTRLGPAAPRPSELRTDPAHNIYSRGRLRCRNSVEPLTLSASPPTTAVEGRDPTSAHGRENTTAPAAAAKVRPTGAPRWRAPQFHQAPTCVLHVHVRRGGRRPGRGARAYYREDSGTHKREHQPPASCRTGALSSDSSVLTWSAKSYAWIRITSDV